MNPNTRAKSMEGGVVCVSIPGFRDGKPGILWIELGHAKGTPDRAPKRSNESWGKGHPWGGDLGCHTPWSLGFSGLNLGSFPGTQQGRPRQRWGVELRRRGGNRRGGGGCSSRPRSHRIGINLFNMIITHLEDRSRFSLDSLIKIRSLSPQDRLIDDEAQDICYYIYIHI